MGKNIIFCFDGTSNHPKDAVQEKEWFGFGQVEDSGITNILKLHALFGGTLANDKSGPEQWSLYYSGIGTYGNRIQRIFNTAFSPEKLDVGRIIKTAGRDLGEIYDKEAGDKLFVFGFSRGAAIARRFCSVLDDYIQIDEEEQPVRFLCAFDTVASIGKPNLSSDDKPVSDVVFEDCWISKNIQEALHILSVDENRVAFQPTLMNQEKRVTEIWFPGAHSDIGGGFWFDGLSDITLDFVLSQLKERDLGVQWLNTKEIRYDKLVAKDKSYQIDFEDVEIKPLIKGKIHPKDRWWPIARATLNHRDIRVQNETPEGTENHEQDGLKPIIHKSLRERYNSVTEYRPRAMKGLKHQICGADGMAENTVYKGLSEYSNPTEE